MAKEKKTGTDALYDIDYYKSLKGNDAMRERLMGRLPIIDIAGHPFFADARIGLLRPMDNFSTMGIDIANISEDKVTKELSFYYHIPSMTQVTIPDDVTEYPKDVVRVTTPNPETLDAVGMAYATGREPGYYLDGKAPVMYRAAKITPLSETPIAAVIQKNKGKQSADKPSVQKKNPIIHKRKKGRGL